MRNIQKFLIRILTSVTLGGLFLISVFYNKFIFYPLVILFQIFAILEIKKMFPNYIDSMYWLLLTIWLDAVILGYLSQYPLLSSLSEFNKSIFTAFSFSMSIVMLIFIVKEIVNSKKIENKEILQKIVLNFFLFFYFIGSLALSFILFEIKNGLFFLVVVITNYSHDIFAYFVGKTLGKKPFFNNISPSKTFEGYLGGVIFSLLIGFLTSFATNIFVLGIIKISLLIISIAVLSAFGDLFESLMKRVANVKESGNVIPGHGGVLDRIDSLIFSIYLASLTYFIVPV